MKIYTNTLLIIGLILFYRNNIEEKFKNPEQQINIIDLKQIISKKIILNLDSISEYRKKMGLGIITLKIRRCDSINFKTSLKGNSGNLVVKLDKNFKLSSKNKNQNYFTPFKYATNFEHYGFIWKSTKNKYDEIILNDDDKTYWLPPSEKNKYEKIKWENYLKEARVTISKQNNFYTEPNEKAKLKNYKKSEVYYVIEVKEMWIKIVPHIVNSEGEINLQNGVWTKWHSGCRKIEILDDTDMDTK